MESYSLLLPELIIVLLGLALIVAELATQRGDKRQLALLGLLGTGAALTIALGQFGTTADVWNQTVRIDPFASFFKIVFLGILILVFLFSGQYLRNRRAAEGEFYILATFATLGAMFVASSYELITIYLGIELLSISSYVLVGFLRDDARSSEGSLKYFLIGAISSAILLYGVSLLYGATGTTNLAGIGAAAATLGSGDTAVLAAGMVFLLVGLGVKVASVPFHMWAPDVYEGAPTPFTAFLITASEAAGFAAALRVFAVGLPSLAGQWSAVFAVLALASMFYGNITAIVQKRTKRMLAYSAIAQAGYVLVGLAVASPAGASAMLYYILAYAFMTMGAFAVVVYLSNHIPSEEIEDFNGLGRRSPILAVAMTILLISLVGLPATGGFFGKLLLFRATLDAGMIYLGAAIVINSVISVPYYFKIVRNMWMGRAESDQPLPAPQGVKWVVGLSLAGVLILGIFPERIWQAIEAITVFGP